MSLGAGSSVPSTGVDAAAQPVLLTVRGAFFGEKNRDATILIGGLACQTSWFADDKLVCPIGPGVGSHAVEVRSTGERRNITNELFCFCF